MRAMLTGRNVLIVLNPTSGRGEADEVATAIAAELERLGAGRTELRRTAEITDASRWAADADGEGFHMVLAVGGDGTVTAVADGMLRSGRMLPIGIVPLGTGNGMARILRLPTDPLKSVGALHAGKVVHLDAVEVPSHDRWAVMFLGAGLDAEINRDADGTQKRRFGFLAYLGATARNLVGRRSRQVTLELDGRRERMSAHTVSVFNAGLVHAAGVEFGPHADPHDGQLDVAVFRSPGLLASLAQTLRLLRGRPDPTELVRAERVRVVAEPPLLFHIDGDVVGSTPFEAHVRPAALAFVADASYEAPPPGPSSS